MLVSVVRVAALLAPLCFAAAACGGSHAQAVKTTQAATTTSKACVAKAAALRKVERDIAVLNRAKKGAATDHATDRFLLDLDTSPISNLQRNRLIDHAAAAVVTKCPQCFQALEADRPIPAIAEGEAGCSS